jgi:hypothetical protein
MRLQHVTGEASRFREQPHGARFSRFRRIAARWSACRVVGLAFISIGRATHLAG